MGLLILVDGTASKVRYKGKLVIVTCRNANNQIYHLAFDIVNSENDRSIYWFFIKLKEVIWDVENLIFTTDRGQVIITNIAYVCLDAHHGYYMYRRQCNLKTKYRAIGIVSLFRKVAEAYTLENYIEYISEKIVNHMIYWSI